MDIFLIVIASILCVSGAVVTFFAKKIVAKFDIAAKQTIRGIEDENNLEALKQQKALLIVKLISAAIFIPGMILFYILLNGL